MPHVDETNVKFAKNEPEVKPEVLEAVVKTQAPKPARKPKTEKR